MTAISVEVVVPGKSKRSTNDEQCDRLKYLQQASDVARTREEATVVLNAVAKIIWMEATGGDVQQEEHHVVNQTLLNVGLHSYYTVLERYGLDDEHFTSVLERLHEERLYPLVFALLLTNRYQYFDAVVLKDNCLRTLSKATIAGGNSTTLVTVVKTVNLLCRRYRGLEVIIPLEHIYHLLQCQGVRDEALQLFSHCCTRKGTARRYFTHINECWPWTNRNKYYLLSSILAMQPLGDVLHFCEHQSSRDFFGGVRLALRCRGLLPASGYLVKSLSNHKSPELLELCVEVLVTGSLAEISNFCSQWFARIGRQDVLFDLLQKRLQPSQVFNTCAALEDGQHARLIAIFTMFSRQIYRSSKVDFFRISTEFITNRATLDAESQLLLFVFIVDNMSSFAIEDCLDFVSSFLEAHKSIADARFRNSTLGRIPNVINYVAKMYNRYKDDDASTLKGSVSTFFARLHRIVTKGIGSDVYQPKIFALRLLESLVRSCYISAPEKNAKNCNVVENRQLGEFLIEESIFDAGTMKPMLVSLLRDSHGSDDAFEIVVSLLQALKYDRTDEARQWCRRVAASTDIEECSMSTVYAKVAVNCFAEVERPAECVSLFEECLAALNTCGERLFADPLLACKRGCHLFGFVDVMAECVAGQPVLLRPHFSHVLDILQEVLNKDLQMLNLRSNDDAGLEVAGSFQDIDESLETLVLRSAFKGGETAACRKLLLLSFWLTLKACCNISSAMGRQLVLECDDSAEATKLLEQCFQLHVSVLTKCRHKGAIEAAGHSIGELTRCITSHLRFTDEGYRLLSDCIVSLFVGVHRTSTTRRGAGLSLLLIHIVKNEQLAHRPLLQLTVRRMLESRRRSPELGRIVDNCDRYEALMLHYMCVLVKTAELREPLLRYHDEMMMIAIQEIDNREWTVCNAALQLFGALVPKILGTKQAVEFDAFANWRPTDVTFTEIGQRMPRTCEYILEYCSSSGRGNGRSSTRTIISFLGFLANVDHLRDPDGRECTQLARFRELMWSLLSHRVEMVRRLAATCFVRLHEFRYDLPHVLLQSAHLVTRVKDENFFQGLLFLLLDGIHKVQNESLYTVNRAMTDALLHNLKLIFTGNFQLSDHSVHSLSRLLDLLSLLNVDINCHVFSELRRKKPEPHNISFDIWNERLARILPD